MTEPASDVIPETVALAAFFTFPAADATAPVAGFLAAGFAATFGVEAVFAAFGAAFAAVFGAALAAGLAAAFDAGFAAVFDAGFAAVFDAGFAAAFAAGLADAFFAMSSPPSGARRRLRPYGREGDVATLAEFATVVKCCYQQHTELRAAHLQMSILHQQARAGPVGDTAFGEMPFPARQSTPLSAASSFGLAIDVAEFGSLFLVLSLSS